jgi:hypothetical protein
MADDLDQVVLLGRQANVKMLARERLDVRRACAMLDRSEAQVG